MEAIKKQATKLREQVAKQQQAVLRHLGHFSNEDITVDEAELQCHQKLQDLYISTKAAKHLQRNIVRGIEGFIATSTKLIEIARKLADDCCNYGAENQDTGSPLARAALYFGKSHKSMEDEREALLGILGEKFNSFKKKLDFLHTWLAEAMAAVKPLALIRNENCGLKAEEKKNKSVMNLSFQFYSTSYLESPGLQDPETNVHARVASNGFGADYKMECLRPVVDSRHL